MQLKVMIKRLFSVGIGEYNLSSYPNKDLLLFILKHKTLSSHSAVEIGNSSFNTDNNILDNSQLKDLKLNIQSCVDDYCKNIGIKKGKISNSWFNVLYPNGKTKRHNHGLSIVSGAYYPILEEDSCNLIFYRPNPLINSNFYFDQNTEFNIDYYSYPIKQNYLYIFPSLLEHGTETNKDKDRVVISFNTNYE